MPTFLFPCKEFSLECSTAMMKYSSGIAWEKRPLSIVQVFFHGGVLFSNGSTLTFRCFGTGLNCSKWIRVDFFFKFVNALSANTTICRYQLLQWEFAKVLASLYVGFSVFICSCLSFSLHGQVNLPNCGHRGVLQTLPWTSFGHGLKHLVP